MDNIIRDMDVAAAVIGIRPMYMLSALPSLLHRRWLAHCGALCIWVPGNLRLSVDRSFSLFLHGDHRRHGPIMGSMFGAAFIVVLPIFPNQFLPALGSLIGVEISTATVAHAEFMIFGSLIVWFLIVEPHGLAKLWSVAKQKLRLWPFPTEFSMDAWGACIRFPVEALFGSVFSCAVPLWRQP